MAPTSDRRAPSTGVRDPVADGPRLGNVQVLPGLGGGRYPHGNTVVVDGRDATVLIDPSLSLVARGGLERHVDVALLTHVHEDHIAGLATVPDTEVHVHWRDQPALRSLDDLVASYGLRPAAADPLRRMLVEDFHFQARPDALPFDDGDRLDVGGSVITAVHLPGHTPGHCAFVVEPEGVVVLGDIDLSTFGPYYADAGSSLVEFEASLARCRELDATWYVTYHHKGVVEGRGRFLPLLDAFAGAIRRRETALLDFLAHPRSMVDLVAHRFLYRAHVDLPWVTSAEEHTIRQHLDRFVEQGRVAEVAPGRYRALAGR